MSRDSMRIGHEELPRSKQSIGLDLGIKDSFITSSGRKYENTKTIKKYEKTLGKLQRQLAHKEKGSKNYNRKRKQIAICHERFKC